MAREQEGPNEPLAGDPDVAGEPTLGDLESPSENGLGAVERPHERLNGAPDPLAHAAPDAELAAASFAGADAHIETPEEEHELEELALSSSPASRTRRTRRTAGLEPATPPERAPAARVNPVQRLIGFLMGSWAELQRVQWPDRRQVAQATGVVIGFVIVAGVFLGLSDLASSHLMDWILK